MTSHQPKNKLGITDLLPRLLSLAPRVPDFITSGISIALLFDHLPLSAGRILEHHARAHGERIALRFEDDSYTYSSLNGLVNRYAHFFKAQGVKRGDVVILFLENRPETLIITMALAKLGAIASLVHPQQRGAVLLHSVGLKCGRHFAVGEEVLDAFEAIRPELEVREPVFMGLRDSGKTTFPSSYLDISDRLQGFPDSNPPDTADIRAEEHLAYIFTSGTTGKPKAAIQTHKKWLRCMEWFGRINLGLQPGDVLYAPLPFFHANAFLIAWPSVLTHGATLVMRRKFSVSAFWPDVRKYHATAFIYIGEICRYLLNEPPSTGDRDHGITKMIGNGLRPDIWQDFQERFGIEIIHEFYGASDSNTIFTNTFNVEGSVGWSPVDFAIVRYDVEHDCAVRNDRGRCARVEKGETGLMLSRISSRFPFDGYVNKSKNEAKILRDVFRKGDAWFNTGDLMRNMGFRHTQFVDRIGDTFRWKGENVATAEVEQIIHELPFVTSCAAYGVTIPGTDGRAGMAAVRPAGQVGEKEIAEIGEKVYQALPPYAVPVFLRFTEQFDMTETQKIRKHSLQKAGFEPTEMKDDIYVMLPGETSYRPMTKEVYSAIRSGSIRF